MTLAPDGRGGDKQAAHGVEFVVPDAGRRELRPEVHAIEVRAPRVEGETGPIAGIARGRLDLPAHGVVQSHIRVLAVGVLPNPAPVLSGSTTYAVRNTPKVVTLVSNDWSLTSPPGCCCRK